MVYKIDDDGDLWVVFCFFERFWVCKFVEMEWVDFFKVGDGVWVKRFVVMLRWGWGIEMYVSRGLVVGVDVDGKLCIKFVCCEGRLWIGDLVDVEFDLDNL